MARTWEMSQVKYISMLLWWIDNIFESMLTQYKYKIQD